jgi:ribosome-binding factor A
MARNQGGRGRGGGKGNSGGRRQRQTSTRHFPRTARLNALLTEIIAGHFERVDHDDLGFVTITGAEVDADLNVCQVYVSTLADPDPIQDDIVLDALAGERKAIQRAIATQAKLRKTPEVVFAFDPAVRAGAKIDSILATLDIAPDDEPAPEPDDSGEQD